MKPVKGILMQVVKVVLACSGEYGDGRDGNPGGGHGEDCEGANGEDGRCRGRSDIDDDCGVPEGSDD